VTDGAYAILYIKISDSNPIIVNTLLVLKKILIFLLAAMLMSHISGQKLVRPNSPYRTSIDRQGFLSINEITYGTGLNVINAPFSRTFSGVTTINGFNLDKNFYTGVGTGIFFYNGGPMLPLFLHLRYRTNYNFTIHNPFLGSSPCPGRSDLTFFPFAYFDGGVLVHLSGDESGTKRFLNTGIGLSYLINKDITADFSAGLFSQFDTLRDSFIRFRLGISYKTNRH